MTKEKIYELQNEPLDNSVPFFNKQFGDCQYEDGTTFECNILSWDKISREIGFQNLAIEENDEE